MALTDYGQKLRQKLLIPVMFLELALPAPRPRALTPGPLGRDLRFQCQRLFSRRKELPSGIFSLQLPIAGN